MEPGDTGRIDPRALDERDLVARMRREDAAALQEFFERFNPMMLQQAARLGVDAGQREEVVLDVLDDAAIALIERTAPPPRSLAAYLAVALRHHVMNASRRDRRDQERTDAAIRCGGSTGGEPVVREVISESSLRASGGPNHDVVTLSPPLERLAQALDARLSDDERRILGWIGQWVPQTVIAEWLGVSYGALRVRVLRLRDRLYDAALAHAAALEAPARAELNEFFRRTGSPRAAAAMSRLAEGGEASDEAPGTEGRASARREAKGEKR